MVSYFIPQAGSEWSAMQFRTDAEDVMEDGGFCSVISNGSLHVLTKNRKYFRAQLLEQGSGELKRE